MPDAVWSVSRFLPNLSRANDYLPVLTSFLRFRHFFSGSLSLISIIHTWSFLQDLFLNAHHNGSLPMQLKVVWSQCLYIDFGRPLFIYSSPISCAASWHTIIRKPYYKTLTLQQWLDLLRKPLVQHIVQIDITQNRWDDPALRSTFLRITDITRFQYSRL